MYMVLSVLHVNLNWKFHCVELFFILESLSVMGRRKGRRRSQTVVVL